MVSVKRAQGANGLIEGGGSEFALVLQVDEEVEDLAGVKFWQRCVRKMLCKLPDPTEIGFDGAFAQTFELDEAGVILIPLGGGEVATS